jgi:hypothetical protein
MKDITPDIMEQIDEERTARGRKVRFTYLADAEILIISIPTRLHERLHLQLYCEITRLTEKMGLCDTLLPDGAARFMGVDGFSESDSAGEPCPPRGADDWMTLIVQSAHIQSWLPLRTKMRKWFTDSKGEVLYILSSIPINLCLYYDLG